MNFIGPVPAARGPAFLSLCVIATLTTPTAGAASSVVISQIYGGGGNSGATLRNDFVELFNRSNVAVSVEGCPDSRVYLCKRDSDGHFVAITEIEDAWQMTYTLDAALQKCHQDGHEFSLEPISGSCQRASFFCWHCLICGAERIALLDTGEIFAWPADAEAVERRTARALPRLHQPLFERGECV